jgi:hypothetical protein
MAARIRLDDLRVLVEENERFQVWLILDQIQDHVVVAEDRSLAPVEMDLRIRLRDQIDTRLGKRFVLVGRGHRASEGNHGQWRLAASGPSA